MKRIFDPKRSPSVYLNLWLFKIQRWDDVFYGWRHHAINIGHWEIVFPIATIKRRWNNYADEVVEAELRMISEFPPE